MTVVSVLLGAAVEVGVGSNPTFAKYIYDTNASESLQMYNGHYKGLVDNKNGLRLVTNMFRMVTNICCEYAFLANFRSMFLIFVKPQNSSERRECLRKLMNA